MDLLPAGLALSSRSAVAAMANDTPFGLSTGIWTQNTATADKK
ncbi:hypothetical protein EJP617_09930 [Erwinia sp. Ejp617]|nr:hypothetical protein EJP617_09930 [Erwinia sp. Ejp617]